MPDCRSVLSRVCCWLRCVEGETASEAAAARRIPLKVLRHRQHQGRIISIYALVRHAPTSLPAQALSVSEVHPPSLYSVKFAAWKMFSVRSLVRTALSISIEQLEGV